MQTVNRPRRKPFRHGMRPARETGREVEAGRKVLAAAAGAEVGEKEEAMAGKRGRGMEDEVRRFCGG